MRLDARGPSAIAVVAVLAVASVAGWWFGDQRRAADTPYRVVRVLDGDTIVVRRAGADEETIRLLGVDTPETHHPTKPVECFGPEASAFTSRRLFGELVRLEPDVEERDLYDRRLAYVYARGERFNDVLLRRGFARLLVIEPNRAHARAMLDAELDAEQHRRGLWSAC
jgi:micrococcal nuclease